MNDVEEICDFNDTFLDLQHLKDSFPAYKIECSASDEEMLPPFQYAS